MKTKKIHKVALTLGSWLRPAAFDSVTVRVGPQRGQPLLWGLRQRGSGAPYLVLTSETSVSPSPL